MSFGIGSNNYYSYSYGTGSISSASNSGSANGAGSAGSAAQSSAAQTTNSVTYKPTAYVPQWQREIDAHLGYSGSADATGSASGSGSANGAGSAGSAGSVSGPTLEEVKEAVAKAAKDLAKSLLEYYKDHGTVEGFSGNCLPYGIEITRAGASKLNSDSSNDTFTITSSRDGANTGNLYGVSITTSEETEVELDEYVAIIGYHGSWRGEEIDGIERVTEVIK